MYGIRPEVEDVYQKRGQWVPKAEYKPVFENAFE
jgi:hypothetical protein